MLGIIAAMEAEACEIINLINDPRIDIIGNKKVYSGIINNQPVAVIICGCGKVNAAFATTILITQSIIKTIIMIGVAGSINNNIK